VKQIIIRQNAAFGHDISNYLSAVLHFTLILSEVSVAEFRTGSTRMFWKLNMDDEFWEEGDFLKKQSASNLSAGQHFACRVNPRGVATIKKNDLVAKLCPLIPSDRKRFWMNLPVNDMSGDLIDQPAAEPNNDVEV
jgi:hypothetical protein